MGKTEPAHKIPLGNITVAIWENEMENQEVWFNVTATRRYKDGDTWKDTTSFRRNDLPTVSKGIDLAMMWILVRERKLAKQVEVDSHPRKPKSRNGRSPSRN